MTKCQKMTKGKQKMEKTQSVFEKLFTPIRQAKISCESIFIYLFIYLDEKPRILGENNRQPINDFILKLEEKTINQFTLNTTKKQKSNDEQDNREGKYKKRKIRVSAIDVSASSVYRHGITTVNH